LDETDGSLVSSTLIPHNPQPAGASDSQQPIMASSLPRHLNDAKNGSRRLSRHSDAATSCEEIIMTVHTNKGCNKNTTLYYTLLLSTDQGDHSLVKPGKVKEFHSGQRK